jgi:hypothetical protein
MSVLAYLYTAVLSWPCISYPEEVCEKTKEGLAKEAVREWMQVASPPSSHASGGINGTLTFPFKFIQAYFLSSGTLNRAHLTCNDTFPV